MALAIFGISNDGLNLAATLFILMLVVVWLALIVYTYLDARRRISDPFLVACATVASFFPYIGTAVYAIVRPPEFLEDAHERELEIKAAELRVRQLTRAVLPQLRVPGREELPALPQLPAPAQGPLPDLRQAGRPALGLCPYCETALAGASGAAQRAEGERRAQTAARDARRATRRRRARKRQPRRPPRAKSRPRAPRAREAAPNRTTQRSPSREPDPDPRQA